MKKTGLLVVMILAVLTFALPARAQDLPEVKLITFAGANNWPIWAAQEQGEFANNGIRIALTYMPKGAARSHDRPAAQSGIRRGGPAHHARAAQRLRPAAEEVHRPDEILRPGVLQEGARALMKRDLIRRDVMQRDVVRRDARVAVGSRQLSAASRK